MELATNLIAAARQWSGALSALVPAYLLLVYVLRHRRMHKLVEEFGYPTRESFAKMTDDDAYKIQIRIAQLEFPFIFGKALQFSLFRVLILYFYVRCNV